MCERNNSGWCFWPYKKMDATSNMVSIVKPAMFDSVIAYADTTRFTIAQMRNKPAAAVIRQALADYLDNCQFDKCVINDGYIKALGVDEALIPKTR